MEYSIQSGRMIITDTSHEIHGDNQVILDKVEIGNWYGYTQPYETGSLFTTYSDNCPDEMYTHDVCRVGMISGQMGIFDYTYFRDAIYNDDEQSCICSKIATLCNINFGSVLTSVFSDGIFDTRVWRSDVGSVIAIYIYFEEN